MLHRHKLKYPMVLLNDGQSFVKSFVRWWQSPASRGDLEERVLSVTVLIPLRESHRGFYLSSSTRSQILTPLPLCAPPGHVAPSLPYPNHPLKFLQVFIFLPLIFQPSAQHGGFSRVVTNCWRLISPTRSDLFWRLSLQSLGTRRIPWFAEGETVQTRVCLCKRDLCAALENWNDEEDPDVGFTDNIPTSLQVL